MKSMSEAVGLCDGAESTFFATTKCKTSASSGDALSFDGKCWYVSLASFNSSTNRKDYKTVRPGTVLLVRERIEARLQTEVIEVPSIAVVNQLSLSELHALNSSLRRENVDFVPANQWQTNGCGNMMRAAELANVQVRVQERISGMSTRERDDTPTYGQVCDAVEEHLNKFADKLQINYTGDLADLVLTEHAERAQDFVSIVEAGRDMRQDILDNIRSPTCICSVCYCELSKRELYNDHPTTPGKFPWYDLPKPTRKLLRKDGPQSDKYPRLGLITTKIGNREYCLFGDSVELDTPFGPILTNVSTRQILFI
jgi:hypothetical protein